MDDHIGNQFMNGQFYFINKDHLRAFLEEIAHQQSFDEPNKWILESEAMSLMGIKSKSHLWKLRTEGSIAYTQPSRKHILYDRESIMEYLETHKKSTF